MSINHKTEKYNLDNAPLNKVQQCAVKLMKNDLRLLFTILRNQKVSTHSYYIALMPYMGLIVDGIEDWVNAYNNSSKHKLQLPTFEADEQIYYAEMRNFIKLFEKGYLDLNNTLSDNYINSDRHYSSLCKPIAKHLHLYDIYGVFYCNSVPCDNTILNQIVTPFFTFGEIDRETIKKMAIIGGEYIAKLFQILCKPLEWCRIKIPFWRLKICQSTKTARRYGQQNKKEKRNSENFYLHWTLRI